MENNKMDAEREKIYWKGHLDKKCPKCSAELVLKEFLTQGFGSIKEHRFAVFAETLKIPFADKGLDFHMIYYVKCECGYQKRTYEYFLSNLITREDKEKREFSEKLKKRIL